MVKRSGISERDGESGGKMGGRDRITDKKKMKRNMQRLGGKGGLSLESFANAKTRNDNYNPALIKKKREFYKNAKYVQKYKRSLKQQPQHNVPSRAERPQLEGETQMNDDNYVKHRANKAAIVNKNMKNKKNTLNLDEMYKKKREEEEKARMEREATIQAKKEVRQQAEARRKSIKEKMFKKTKSGQPVMKYRIEHILETIQGSSN